MIKTKFIKDYLDESSWISQNIDIKKIANIIDIIKECKDAKGRIFFLGVGGSAANASHAVNDFRKIVEIEAYTPADNVSELTARTNDEGWEHVFESWLKISKLDHKDLIFIFSVGGGNEKKNISSNLIKAIKLAKLRKTKILSVLGKDDGYAAKNSDVALVIPIKNKNLTTPFSEAYQAVIWHLIVSHPKLKENETMWESVVEEK